MRSRSRRALSTGLVPLALLAVSHGGCKTAPPPPPPSGQLFLELSPAQASVLVDDRPILRKGPSSAALRVSLPAGAHRVEIYAPGYFHAYRDIAITAAAESRLQVALRPDPDVVP